MVQSVTPGLPRRRCCQQRRCAMFADGEKMMPIAIPTLPSSE